MNSPCTILAALEYTAQTRRRPEGRWGGAPIPFRDFKISILTVPSQKRDICGKQMSLFLNFGCFWQGIISAAATCTAAS